MKSHLYSMSILYLFLFDVTQCMNESDSSFKHVTIKNTNKISTNHSNVTLVRPHGFTVELYSFPFIIIIGTISNSLTFLVMRRKKMRNQSTYFYMGVLAIADEMVLLVGCLNFWLYVYTGKSFIFLSVLSCKITCMALYATLHFSVWIVVIMTVERFIAVALPLQANRLCTVRRAKIATSILAFLVFAVNFHFIITHSLIGNKGKEECKSTEALYSSFMSKVWPWIDGTIYSFIPLSLLILFNILILINLFKASKSSESLRMKTVKMSTRKMSQSSHTKPLNEVPKKDKSNTTVRLSSTYSHHNQQYNQSNFNRKLTIMLITVSITFCVTSMPIVTLQSIEQAGIIESSTKSISVLRGFFLVLQYLNHSINFFLYAITGKMFRREFIALFLSWKCFIYKLLGLKTPTQPNRKNSIKSCTERSIRRQVHHPRIRSKSTHTSV